MIDLLTSCVRFLKLLSLLFLYKCLLLAVYLIDADNPADLSTAKAGDKIGELLYKHNDVIFPVASCPVCSRN
jgi:hypothetical protein